MTNLFKNIGSALESNIVKKTLGSSTQSGELSNELITQVGKGQEGLDLTSIVEQLQKFVIDAGQIKDGFMLGDTNNVLDGLDGILGSLNIDSISELMNNLSPENLMSALKLETPDFLSNFDLNGLLEDLKNGNLVDSIGGLFGGLLGIDISKSDPMNDLFKCVSETLVDKFGLEIGTDKMLSILQNKLMKFIGSKIYIPEKIYLETIKPMLYLGADTKYNEEYLRYELVLKKDYELVLTWLDTIEHYYYDYDVIKRDSDISTFNSSVNCTKYMLVKLKNDYNELERYISDYNITLNSFDRQIEDLVNNGISEKDIEERKNNYINDRIGGYNTSKKMIKMFKQAAIEVVRNMIIRSRSNLNVNLLASILKIFDISPSIFGEYDDEYNGKYLITDNDINYMAPFVDVKEDDYQYSFNLANDKIYINPINNNIKKIYIYLTSEVIHGSDAMIHKSLYDRLQYPIISLLEELGREAFTGGITINELPPNSKDLIYTYTKSVETLLYDPLAYESVRKLDGTVLPKPLDPQTEEDKIKEKERVKLTESRELYENEKKVLRNLIDLIIKEFKQDKIDRTSDDEYNDIKYDDFYNNVNIDISRFTLLLNNLNETERSMNDINILNRSQAKYYESINNSFNLIHNHANNYKNAHGELKTNWFVDDENDQNYLNNIIIQNNKKTKIWESIEIIFNKNINDTVELAKKYSISIEETLVRYNELYGNSDNKPLFCDKECKDINIDHRLAENLILYELRTGKEKVASDDFSQIMPAIIIYRQQIYTLKEITKLREFLESEQEKNTKTTYQKFTSEETKTYTTIK